MINLLLVSFTFAAPAYQNYANVQTTDSPVAYKTKCAPKYNTQPASVNLAVVATTTSDLPVIPTSCAAQATVAYAETSTVDLAAAQTPVMYGAVPTPTVDLAVAQTAVGYKSKCVKKYATTTVDLAVVLTTDVPAVTKQKCNKGYQTASYPQATSAPGYQNPTPQNNVNAGYQAPAVPQVQSPNNSQNAPKAAQPANQPSANNLPKAKVPPPTTTTATQNVATTAPTQAAVNAAPAVEPTMNPASSVPQVTTSASAAPSPVAQDVIGEAAADYAAVIKAVPQP
ncbi:hypothetical protein HDV06_001269 [Boothiomyces sp. JEL0866]|nr:hypothetical protein HDV06_001269 [Boothiomyces sp. JEL0866]